MRFVRVGIQGFKSFGPLKVLDFPEESGFFFFTGENRVEPDLEGNAAGKTTTWDAICWCLYGKTPRNMKASDVKNWYRDEKVVVWLELVVDDEFYRITRTWNPNSLTLESGKDLSTSKKITQDEVVNLIKLDFDHFLYSILFSQFREQFFDLKQAEKSDLFAQILNLEEWEVYSKRASSQASQLSAFLNDLNMTVSEYGGKVSSLEELDFSEKIAQWEEDHENEILEKKHAIKLLEESVENLRKEAVKSKKELDKLNESLESFTEDSSAIENVLKDAKKELSLSQQEIAEINADIRSKQNQLKKLKSSSDTCPTCGQNVDISHIKAEIKTVEKDLSALEKDLEDANASKSEISDIVADVEQELADLKESVMDKLVKKKELEATDKVNKAEVGRTLVQVNREKSALEDLEKKKNPYEEEEKENVRKIKVLKEIIQEKNLELLATSKRLDQVTYWIKAFKNIRLFVISEVLTQLELEVNNCLFRLGLKDWRIELDIDKETKSGTVRKGFTVNVFSPYNKDPVAWESWSGGETQRLKLAGTIGLSNLILARCGVESFIEIYDEPSNWLSQKGIDQMLETLASRSKEVNKQVWIIDHRSLDFGGFDGIYSVVKNSEGSQFVKNA